MHLLRSRDHRSSGVSSEITATRVQSCQFLSSCIVCRHHGRVHEVDLCWRLDRTLVCIAWATGVVLPTGSGQCGRMTVRHRKFPPCCRLCFVSCSERFVHHCRFGPRASKARKVEKDQVGPTKKHLVHGTRTTRHNNALAARLHVVFDAGLDGRTCDVGTGGFET